MNEVELYQKAVKKWGTESQLDMVIEECSELINAIQKRRRGRVADDAVLEEAVDVELCLEQLKLMLNNDVGWLFKRSQKLQRLANLLGVSPVNKEG